MARLPSIENLSEPKIQLLKRKVIAVIKERGLVQRRVAEASGVAATSLNRILNPRNPRFTSEHTARRLAASIGLPYDVLVDEDYDVAATVRYVREGGPVAAPAPTAGDACGCDAAACLGHRDDAPRVPPHVAQAILMVGVDEAVRRMLLNAGADDFDGGAVPDYVARMVEAIGPMRALRRILAKPEAGEVSA
jgi:transcriptional regulator with XRE-family HTH domain